MAGPRAFALVLLVTLGTVGAIAVGATQQGPAMTVQPVENGSNYLGPNAADVDRSGQATASLDVAATVGANAGSVRSTFSRVSVRKRYEAAATPSDRRRVVGTGVDRLARRVAALERREVRAIDRYAAGERGETDLLRTLASVDAEAAARAETARWLESRAVDLEMATESRRLSTLRIRLLALRGPVRTDVAAGLDGSKPTRVHVETADGGLVLATVERNAAGEYVYAREAYSPAIRNRRGGNRYEDFGEVFNRLAERYPWVNARSPRVDDSVRIGRAGEGAPLYSMEFNYDRGWLTPYLDGGTGRVVKEDKRRELTDRPIDRSDATSDDGTLAVTVRTTYASGPVAVNATDPATGRPVNATVLVDGERVGPTRRGTRWTVEPRGAVNVTVVRGDATVTTTVRAP